MGRCCWWSRNEKCDIVQSLYIQKAQIECKNACYMILAKYWFDQIYFSVLFGLLKHEIQQIIGVFTWLYVWKSVKWLGLIMVVHGYSRRIYMICSPGFIDTLVIWWCGTHNHQILWSLRQLTVLIIWLLVWVTVGDWSHCRFIEWSIESHYDGLATGSVLSLKSNKLLGSEFSYWN